MFPVRQNINSGSSDGMPPVDKSKFEQFILAEGYCPFLFLVTFFFWARKRKKVTPNYQKIFKQKKQYLVYVLQMKRDLFLKINLL